MKQGQGSKWEGTRKGVICAYFCRFMLRIFCLVFFGGCVRGVRGENVCRVAARGCRVERGKDKGRHKGARCKGARNCVRKNLPRAETQRTQGKGSWVFLAPLLPCPFFRFFSLCAFAPLREITCLLMARNCEGQNLARGAQEKGFLGFPCSLAPLPPFTLPLTLFF